MDNRDARQLIELLAGQGRIRQTTTGVEFLDDTGVWRSVDSATQEVGEQLLRTRRVRGRNDIQITTRILVEVRDFANGSTPSVQLWFKHDTKLLKRIADLPRNRNLVEGDTTTNIELRSLIAINLAQTIVQYTSYVENSPPIGTGGYRELYTILFSTGDVQLFHQQTCRSTEGFTVSYPSSLDPYRKYLVDGLTGPDINPEICDDFSIDFSDALVSVFNRRLSTLQAPDGYGGRTWVTALQKKQYKQIETGARFVAPITEFDLNQMGLSFSTPLDQNLGQVPTIGDITVDEFRSTFFIPDGTQARYSILYVRGGQT